MSHKDSSNIPLHFEERVDSALESDTIRENFRGAMDFLRDKRHKAFHDQEEFESLREEGSKIRRYAVDNAAKLLEQLEANCETNGISVHWAETGSEANQIIENIALENKAKLVIKGKSMASEEIELNQHLHSLGIECIESDMGEYIVQIANETPSHIIMPAIHKNKEEIASLFNDKLDLSCDPNDVDGMIGIARNILRKKFEHADIGISGVNFAAADTGTLCLVENEGNGRLSTTAPPIHIAIMGLEKVIPSLQSLPTLQKLLTRSATGQAITTYLNLISRPRQPDELDGPKEVHLVILDNGRSKIQQQETLKETLACIRCGACMNHCPVYTKIGGHAYGTTYPGPIGQVLTPQLKGMTDYGDLLDACSLNGACGEACPVNINLPELVRELRDQRSDTSPRSKLEKYIWTAWRWINSKPTLYHYLLKLTAYIPSHQKLLPAKWTQIREPSPVAKKSFQAIWKEQQDRNEKLSDNHIEKD